jgi:predicted negative regulator of RcsB-dependent stress response
MQAQDTTTLFFLKLWPWVETNKNRLIGGGVIALVAVFIIWFVACQRESKEIAAGQALTQVALSASNPSAEAYFSDAQTQFQKFLDGHSDSEFSGQAALGVAACLDAQGKTDLAVSAYQRVVNGFSDASAASAAKFGLARIDESQGKLNDALVFYQDVARDNSNGSLGSEAEMHLIELRNKLPAAAPATTPAAPSKSGK